MNYQVSMQFKPGPGRGHAVRYYRALVDRSKQLVREQRRLGQTNEESFVWYLDYVQAASGSTPVVYENGQLRVSPQLPTGDGTPPRFVACLSPADEGGQVLQRALPWPSGFDDPFALLVVYLIAMQEVNDERRGIKV